MTVGNASAALVLHLVVLSLVSFGGIPAALPDLQHYVVANRWMTEQDFANCFAVVQAIPGPNMILLTSFVGWQVGGLPAAILAGLATFVPSCVLCLACFQVWDRFRDRSWQSVVRRGLAPVTIGLIIAGGFVVARAGSTGWTSIAVTVAAGTTMLTTRINPLWIIAAAAVIGGFGLL